MDVIHRVKKQQLDNNIFYLNMVGFKANIAYGTVYKRRNVKKITNS